MVNLWHKYIKANHQKKQALHSLFVGLVFFVVLFLITKFLAIPLCPIYNIFGVKCLGCGMTSGFIAILQFDFIKAIECNVISIPLFLGIVVYSILCFTDILFDKNIIERIERQLSKKYMYILYGIIALLASVFNNF